MMAASHEGASHATAVERGALYRSAASSTSNGESRDLPPFKSVTAELSLLMERAPGELGQHLAGVHGSATTGRGTTQPSIPGKGGVAVRDIDGGGCVPSQDGKREYLVKDRDTLTSIAAFFDLTPSHLKKFNRMTLDYVYPGQVIMIPRGQEDKYPAALSDNVRGSVAKKQLPQKARAPAPVPIMLSDSDAAALDMQCLEMFIKTPAEHITDSHGAIRGTLLVTPSGIMFDPDTACMPDRDSGIFVDTVFAPMKMISSATVYRDVSASQRTDSVAHESSRQTDQEDHVTDSEAAAASSYAVAAQTLIGNHDVSSEPGTLRLGIGGIHGIAQSHGLMQEARQRGKADSRERVTNDDHVPAIHSPEHATSSLCAAVIVEGVASGEKHAATSEAAESEVSRSGMHHKEPSLDVAAVDYGLEHPTCLHLPVLADKTFYLCLRASVPADGSSQSITHDNELYNQRKKPEHWFILTDANKLESMYSFLLKWKPDTGECHHSIDSLTNLSPLVQSQTPIWQQALSEETFNVGTARSPYKRKWTLQKEWEVTSNAEMRVTSTLMDAEKDLPLPSMNAPSSFLTEAQRRQLAQALPYRIEGNEWHIVYSTELHGFSLSQLYLKMRSVSDSPILLVLQDTAGTVFGALTSCPLAVSDHFYGTGESFLFTFADRFKVYPWTGENNLFIRSSLDNLWIGTGKGTFGLYLDGGLCQGRTQHCKTYNNDPLTGGGEDFVLRHMEAWCFFS